jgi:hypothetical protein
MTQEEQIAEALKVLSPDPDRLTIATDAIRQCIVKLEEMEMDERPLSKEAQATFNSLLSALRRAKRYADKLSTQHVGCDDLLNDLKLPESIALLEGLKRPPGRPFFWKQVRAVVMARGLIEIFGDPKQIVATRGKTWHRLSAIIYGDPTADLFNVMRQTLSLGWVSKRDIA